MVCTKGALAICVASAGAAADREPWSDDDPPAPPARHAVGEYGLAGGAEYRAQALVIDPVTPNELEHARVSWIEHRLRLDGAADFARAVRIVASLDALDGGLWGDNGAFGGDPAANSGGRVSASNPNHARPGVGFTGGDDPTDPDNYGYVLLPGDPVRVRRAYGEVVTPLGLLRVGRQPTTDGTALLVADGDGRRNRFGVARAGDSSDRVLFATKPLEAFRPAAARDMSPERGLFLVLAYDRVVTSDVHILSDDVHMVVESLRLRAPASALGADLSAALSHAYRWDTTFDTDVHSVGVRGMARAGSLGWGAEFAAVLGGTREVSEALSLISSDPVTNQTLRSFGARGVVRWDRPRWSAYLEVDYASGDDDPRPTSDLTQFVFAEDANVGLLLFEHVLAFETARSAAAGTELLRTLGAATLPTERVDTEGSFTNAIALFPQADLRPRRDLLLRGGVLVAWTASRLVDPVQTLRSDDGATIEDDLVNYNGGRPGRFYGVELCGRFQWRFREHFAFDLEGALLFPGDALEDENGRAVRGGLVQGRTTFWL